MHENLEAEIKEQARKYVGKEKLAKNKKSGYPKIWWDNYLVQCHSKFQHGVPSLAELDPNYIDNNQNSFFMEELEKQKAILKMTDDLKKQRRKEEMETA